MEYQSIRIKYRDFLPKLFENSEHFTPQEYYQEMITVCPELKKKWFEKIPSEKKIQQMIIEVIGHCVIDGQESVPLAEKMLGIQINPNYKYPDGISEFNYHYEQVQKYGLFNFLANTPEADRNNCFTKRLKFGKSAYVKKLDKRKAYLMAWARLHYPNRQAMKASLQTDWDELCKLNPSLKQITFDKNDVHLLFVACSGVIYGFPEKDIQLFLNNKTNGVLVALKESARILQDMSQYDFPKDFHFGWVTSSETIHDVGRRYQQHKAKQMEITKNISYEM